MAVKGFSSPSRVTIPTPNITGSLEPAAILRVEDKELFDYHDVIYM